MLLNRIVKFNFVATLDGEELKGSIDIEKSHLKGMGKEQTKDFVEECVRTYIERFIKIDIL